MAENKDTFIAYREWEDRLKFLTDEEAGKLFKHILAYVSDRNPEFGDSDKDRILKMAFEPIKQQLKRDLRKYEETKEQNSLNGKLGNLKRYNKDLYNQVVNKKISIEEAEIIAVSRKMSPPETKTSPPDQTRQKGVAIVADNVNVDDNDNVNVNDSNVLLKKEPKEENLSSENPDELFPQSETLNTGSKKEKSSAKKEKGNNEDEKVLVLQFDSETFRVQWDLYKIFRKKTHKFSFFDIDSENRTLKKLFNLAEGDEKFAIRIIQNSIDNGYKGLFLPKTEENGKTNSNTNNSFNNKTGNSGGSFNTSGKVSARTLLARKLDQKTSSDRESGNFTIDVEAIE